MARLSAVVVDGPQKGEVAAVEPQHHGEVEFPGGDGRVAVYRIECSEPFYDQYGRASDRRHEKGLAFPYEACLIFVGWAVACRST